MMASGAAQQDRINDDAAGLPFAMAAYVLWGFIPIYFKLIAFMPGDIILAHRVIWTLPFCLGVLLIRKLMPHFWAVWRDPKTMMILVVSALLIATNWLVFIIAVNSGHILATSLAYYLNPLLNVLLGVVFLGERLSRLAKISVAVAMCGVALLIAGALSTLWIALTLSISFALYGLLRKKVSVAAAEGLAVETCLLLPFALGYLLWVPRIGDVSVFPDQLGNVLLILAAGLVTGAPLLLFTAAARRMRLATLGFVQYLAPSISFLIGLYVFDEPLVPVQLACFALIWTSIAIFVADNLMNMRRARAARRSTKPGPLP